ncbi:MAG TPA: hypothetical protein VEH47_08065 [Candidatus Acidoferrales bacterium]|nr:hypothetical protein [Candidatus Acidoferrales bacterium]
MEERRRTGGCKNPGNYPLTVGIENSDTVFLSPGRFFVEKGYDPTVRIPDQVLKSVAFIGEVTHRDEQGNVFGDLHATGFFVSIRSPRFPELRHVYFVTAKHVAEDLKDRIPYILVNTTNGGQTHIYHYGPRWFYHPTDPTADVAVLQIGEQPNTDHLAVLTKDFVNTEDIANREWVDVGDEVFVTGLFTPAPGQKRNMPIVRHGNIAMIPTEQIQTELGFSDVYLVEGRSIGGLSGSPVFVRRTETFKLQLPNGRITEVNVPGPFKLFGVMQGHWDIKESEMNKALVHHDREHGVNMGIAIVTPAVKILDILEQPGMKLIRDLADEDLGRTRGSVPGSDSAKKKATDEKSLTQTDFEDVLTQVSRKLSDRK